MQAAMREKGERYEVGSTYMYSEVAYLGLACGQHGYGVAGAGCGCAEWAVFLQDEPPVVALKRSKIHDKNKTKQDRNGQDICSRRGRRIE